MDYFRLVEARVVEDVFLPCPCRLDAKKSSMKKEDDIVLPFCIVVDVPESKGKKDKCGGKLDSSTDESSDSSEDKADDSRDSVSDGDDADGDGHSESDHAPLPLRTVIGIQNAGVAPTARKSACWICDANIDKNTRRVHYRIRNSNAFEHLRYVHMACVNALPIEKRADDRRVVRSWLKKPELSDLNKAVYEEVLSKLK